MKDRFSDHANKYAVYRPTYPAVLYDHILSKTTERGLAWDCGTGNGQVARDLTPHFKKVMATDISQKQIDHATLHPNIEYINSACEKTPFRDQSFDLVTVAQAIHWFDIGAFYNEVNRVGKKNGVLAAWGYYLPRLSSEIDRLMDIFYNDIIGAYWDSERKIVENLYRDIPFPFPQREYWTGKIVMSWGFDDLIGYVNTWSAVQNYIRTHQINPVGNHFEALKLEFKSKKIAVSFPLFLWTGLIP